MWSKTLYSFVIWENGNECIIKVMNIKPIKLTALCALAGSFILNTVNAATFSLANETGDFRARMTSAVNKAHAGDTIIVDKNYTVGAWYTLSKPGITIKGNRTLTATRAHVLRIEASNTSVEGLTFINGTQSIKVQSGSTLSNLKFDDIEIKGNGYAGLFFNDTNLDNVTITNSVFRKSFGVLMEDAERFTNIRISNNTFHTAGTGNGHEISLDCAEVPGALNHRNVRIESNTFYKTEAFNVALANISSCLIVNNTMYGGSNAYSQCVHIEDRTANTYIKNNIMWNTGEGRASHAVLLYATDRSGRGQGDILTQEQKINIYSPRNISLEGNKINGAAGRGVQISLLRPGSKVNFYGENNINADDTAIAISRYVETDQLNIGNATTLKGQAWSSLKNRSTRDRSDFVNW